jgi:hypothetical protein
MLKKKINSRKLKFLNKLEIKYEQFKVKKKKKYLKKKPIKIKQKIIREDIRQTRI